jgi:dimethylhistidine N-methyltransferase
MIDYLRQPVFIQMHQPDVSAIRKEIVAGLTAAQAEVSPKYLYDTLGSRLFSAICELPEYYPTRTEAAIFERHGSAIAASIDTGVTLIDLGAGDCRKAGKLFPVLKPAQYVAADISAEFLRDSIGLLQLRFPHMDMLALGIDFSSAFSLPQQVRRASRLFFYPGSSIGNFTPAEAETFLSRVREACGDDGGLLIGIDLVKETETLNAAYDDALSVTASFNLNLLLHLNKTIGTNFEVRRWRHRAFFNPEEMRVEMHLEARRDLLVKWSGGERRFREGERIHTENSYKYTPDDFHALLRRAGFDECRSWTDEKDWFMVCHARAR